MILNPTLKELPTLKDENSDTYKSLFKYVLWTIGLNFKLLPKVVTFRTLYNIYNNVEPILYGYIWGRLIDAFVSKDLTVIYHFLGYYILVLLLSHVLSVIGDRLDSFGRMISVHKYRVFFSQIISSLSIPLLESSEISNRVYRLNESYSSMWELTRKVSNMFSYSITGLIALSVVVGSSWEFSLLIFFVILLRAYVHGNELKEDWNFTSSHTENKRIADGFINSLLNIDSLKEIIMTNTKKFFLNKSTGFFDWYYGVLAKMRLKKGLYDSAFEVLFVLILGAVMYTFIDRYINNTMTIGDITFMVVSFRSYISSMKSAFGSIVAVGEAKERVKDAYMISHMKIDEEVSGEKVDSEEGVSIEFKDVNFTYPSSKVEVISDLNLSIKQGEKVAIVGENGAGKTTLMSILLGFYPVTSGKVLINGIDINTIDLKTWYSNIGMLLQNYNRYPYMSLEDNILLGRRDGKRLKKVLNMFGIDNIMSKYEFGIKQMLSPVYANGTAPSGGQMQKIAMARIILRDTPVVVLDEPTSALDPISEENVFNNLFEELKGKTVIIISHRFSTVKKADRILVMKEGRIVEEGTHRQLMNLKGVYHDSYHIQAKAYRD